MAEYIDRNYIGKAYIDLCKALSQKSKICPGANEPTVKDVFALVMHAPAADVVEVRHGRWLTTDAYPHHLYCSVCYKTYAKNAKWVNELDLPTNYCPNCGARMDKEDDHEVSKP